MFLFFPFTIIYYSIFYHLLILSFKFVHMYNVVIATLLYVLYVHTYGTAQFKLQKNLHLKYIVHALHEHETIHCVLLYALQVDDISIARIQYKHSLRA